MTEKSATTVSSSSGQISGNITIDAKFKANIDPNAALFIIARPAGERRRPAAGREKNRQADVPADYSLGQDNVMMQGMPFTGKINITARLDKDGNPVTRSPGDMTGDYKKNPVEVGAKNVDVTLDQVAR